MCNESGSIANEWVIDQAGILIEIERLVEWVIENVAESNTETTGGYPADAFSRLPDLLSFWAPGHEYSEHIEAFWHACEKVGLLECGIPTHLVNGIRHSMDLRHTVMAELIGRISEYVKQVEFHRRMNDRRYEKVNKDARLESFLSEILGRYHKTLIVRVDLGFRRGSNVTIAKVLSDFEVVRNQIRSGEGIYQDYMGYVWCIEQGTRKGYHIHLAVLFAGSLRRNDWYIGQQIGESWREIAGPCAIYHNRNADKESFRLRGRLGIGMIYRSDAQGVQNAIHAITYFTDPEKDDQFLRMKPFNRRAYGVGGLTDSERRLQTLSLALSAGGR